MDYYTSSLPIAKYINYIRFKDGILWSNENECTTVTLNNWVTLSKIISSERIQMHFCMISFIYTSKIGKNNI